MSGLSRKQREIQERERQILAIARPILLEKGYQALGMKQLADQMEYAKGTLYNHFPHKEEIVAALAIESMELRRKLFEMAAVARGNSRERMAAIGCVCECYAVGCPEHFAIEQLLRNAIIWEKASEQRQELIRQCESRVMGIVAGIVRDAVAQKDLEIPQGMSPEEFVFGFWSLTYGSHVLRSSSPSLPEIGVNDPGRSVRYHAWTLMNGYNWKPAMSFEQTESLMNELAERIMPNVR